MGNIRNKSYTSALCLTLINSICELLSQFFHLDMSLSLWYGNSQLRKENSCGPIPPLVQVKETEVITEEAVITTLKRALSFFSSIQAHDGHWPAESAGPLFFLQPMVCIFKPFVSKKHSLSLSLSLSIHLLKKIKMLSKNYWICSFHKANQIGTVSWIIKKTKKAHQIGAISRIYFLIFWIQALKRTSKRVCINIYCVYDLLYGDDWKNLPSDLFVTFNFKLLPCR